jgi:CRP-like cAMP-binding protein
MCCREWHDSGMADREELIDAIAGFGLFADLSTPQLAGIVHTFEEMAFGEGERVLRQGLTGGAFYVILDGEAAVVVDGGERARLSRGDFFGEVSILLGEPPIADIVATRPLRCLVLGGSAVEGFLVAHPRVMYRMLQAQARRLRAANRWRS